MFPFKQYLTGLTKATVKLLVPLRNAVSFYHESVLKSYTAVVRLVTEPFATDDDKAKLSAEVRNLRQRSMTRQILLKSCGQRR